MNKIDIDKAAKQVVSALGDKKYTKEDVEKIMKIAKGLMINDAIISSGDWEKSFNAESDELMMTIGILVNNREGFTLTFTDRK
nr:MAG TPA: hypothetical protein [Caudoviricetes sp.]